MTEAEFEAELRDLHEELEARTRLTGTTQLASFFALLIAMAALVAVGFKLDGNSASTAPVGAVATGPGMMAAGTQGATPAPSDVALTINHVQRGCHVFAVAGGTQGPTQTVQVAKGGKITITNSDVMPHLLQQTGGPTVQMSGQSMSSMNARSTVTFNKPGTYTFRTKAGEDYPGMTGMSTIGPDNKLSLTVGVS